GRSEEILSMGYSFLRMRKLLGGVFLLGVALAVLGQGSPGKKGGWPKSLAGGLPKGGPGDTPAPTGRPADTDQSAKGDFTHVARSFQRIESPSVTRQFQLVVQDYGKEKDLEPQIRKAMAEASTHPGVEMREAMLAGRKAFAVTDRSSGNPTTLITVIV